MTEQSKQLTAIGQICQAVDLMEDNLAMSLSGTGVSTKRFIASAKTAIQTHQDVKGLESADRKSLFLAIQKSAADGLLPDGRESALVVYNTNVGTKDKPEWKKLVNYQPMTQGLVKLARNSGEIESIGAYIVYDADKFSYKAGVDTLPSHEADWFGKRGNPIGVWAFVKLKSGDYLDPVMMTRERINRIATRSKVAKNYDPVQGQDWEEWWKKAAIRNILKYAPKSTALESAMKEDDDKEFDFAEENISYEPEPVNPISDKPKTKTRAAAAIEKKAAQNEPTADDIINVDYETGEVAVEEDEEIPI